MDGIEWCIDKERLYLLGELHYQYGYNAELEGDLQFSLQYMNKACLVFELQDDKRFLAFIQKKMEGLKVRK